MTHPRPALLLLRESIGQFEPTPEPFLPHFNTQGLIRWIQTVAVMSASTKITLCAALGFDIRSGPRGFVMTRLPVAARFAASFKRRSLVCLLAMGFFGTNPAIAHAGSQARGCTFANTHAIADIAALALAFPGRVGFAIRQIGCPNIVGQHLADFYPQQSVAKLWVAMTVLDQIDRRHHDLDESITVTPNDFTVFNQPLRAIVARRGAVTLTLARLLEQAITRSDNLANERLLRLAGGPAAIERFFRSRSLGAIRFGPGEDLLQARIAGIRWSASDVEPKAFDAARRRLSQTARHAALADYLAAPVDGATPAAIATALTRLASGELLSATSTRFLLAIMADVKTGPRRITAGLKPGWKISHKTGTGQILGRTATGFNDVALLTAPNGTRYALVIMIAQTEAGIPARLALMQAITRSLVRIHNRGSELSTWF